MEKIWSLHFLLIILANCFLVNSYLMLTPTFPIYIGQKGYPQDVIGLLTGIFTVTAMISRPFVGRALDAGKRREAYLFGQLVCLVAVLLYPFAHSFLSILVLRLIHGIGIGFTTTAANTIATDFIPRSRMAEGIGYFGVSTVISMAIAPGLGLYVFHTWGANPLFLSSAGLVLVGAVLGLLIRYRKAKVLDSERESGKLSMERYFEKRAVKPATVVFFLAISFSVISTFLSLYAAELGIENIGLFFTVFALTTMVSRPVAGLLADKRGFHYAILPGIVLVEATLVILYAADSMAFFLLAAVTFGLGYGAAQSTLQAMSVRNVPENRRGSAISTFYLGLDLSIGIGSMLAGVVAKHTGYGMMYLLTCVPIGVSLLLHLLFSRKRARVEESLHG